jgi:hypothetical protein
MGLSLTHDPAVDISMPEFDTWHGRDGLLHGRHRSTGIEVCASSLRALRIQASAARIAASIRGPSHGAQR